MRIAARARARFARFGVLMASLVRQVNRSAKMCHILPLFPSARLGYGRASTGQRGAAT